jgi:hypothetical protein
MLTLSLGLANFKSLIQCGTTLKCYSKIEHEIIVKQCRGEFFLIVIHVGFKFNL